MNDCRYSNLIGPPAGRSIWASWLLPVLLLALPAAAQAQFTWTTNNGTVTITGYAGPGGAVVIPPTINGWPVTSIGDSAFSGSGLSSVTIGDSVTSIGANAFEGCGALHSVTIPNSVTNIGDGAFSGSGLLSVTMGDSVTSIGANVFEGCGGLRSVTIPNSVASIGDHAFNRCTGLFSVTIPNSVTSIGDDAFEDCYGLTSVTIGNSVTSIGDDAFEECSSLHSVTIPRSVTNIGDGAFLSCNVLTGAYFEGNAPSSFGSAAFAAAGTGFTIYYPATASGWTTCRGYETEPYNHALRLIRGSGTVTPSFTGLRIASNYELQISFDLDTWYTGAAFGATNTSEVYAQPFDVRNVKQLFFRLLWAP